jgi:hypothetical protein
VCKISPPSSLVFHLLLHQHGLRQRDGVEGGAGGRMAAGPGRRCVPLRPFLSEQRRDGPGPAQPDGGRPVQAARGEAGPPGDHHGVVRPPAQLSFPPGSGAYPLTYPYRHK